MNNRKSSFFMIFALAGSVVQAQSLVVQSDIFYEISKGNAKAVKAWIKSNPNFLIKNAEGKSVLHVAVLNNHRKIVKMLVKAGAFVNALDAAGKTALDCSVEQGSVKTTYDLIKNNALIACVANEKPLKVLIVKRMTRLYKIFGAISAVAIALSFGLFFIIDAICIGWNGLYFTMVVVPPLMLIGLVGLLEMAGLSATCAVRKNRSYLLWQDYR